MAVIRVPQQYANRRMLENVRESFQTFGELCILIKMYHTFTDDPDIESPEEYPRCPRCWDPFYKESTDMSCEVCGGTGIASDDTSRGIKQFGRAWVVIADNSNSKEMLRKYGQWEVDDREVKMEGGIEPDDHDYLVRVQQWSPDYRPLELGGRFRIDNPNPVSLRSGNEPGQSALDNIIGYTMKAHLIRNYHPVAQFDFPSDQPIPRFYS